MDNSNPFALDKGLARAAFNKAAAQYNEAAVLQREVGQRMLERLDLIVITPESILDIGSGTGLQTKALAQKYTKARVIAVDFAVEMLEQARRQISFLNRWLGKRQFVCADAESLPITDHSIDMVFSNLTLQWCNDLDKVFNEFRRVLKPGGLLLFSSFGPDTLKELRSSWKSVDDFSHVNTFIDMHDIGDALMRMQFSDPVMDVENFTLTYKDTLSLMRDLKKLGAHNVTLGRQHGLTGKGKLNAVKNAYEKYRTDGLLPATYEVVYGHAWVLDQANRHMKNSTSDEVTVPISELNYPKKS